MPKPHMVRIPDAQWQLLAEFAAERRRSVANMLEVILDAALADDTPFLNELERRTP